MEICKQFHETKSSGGFLKMTEKKEFQVNKNTPFWDASLTDQERIDWLLKEMTVEEKTEIPRQLFAGSATPWHSRRIGRR